MGKFERLENLRKEKKYTLQNMADFIGVTKPYYWQIENKKRRLYYANAKKIAQVFKLKPDDIFYD